MVGCELDVNLFWLVDVLRDGSLDDPAVNTYRIFLEIFPNDGSSNLLCWENKLWIFCILGSEENFWSSQKYSLVVTILKFSFGDWDHLSRQGKIPLFAEFVQN